MLNAAQLIALLSELSPDTLVGFGILGEPDFYDFHHTDQHCYTDGGIIHDEPWADGGDKKVTIIYLE